MRHPLQHLRGSAVRALRSQGLHVDLLGEDLTSKVMEVCAMHQSSSSSSLPCCVLKPFSLCFHWRKNEALQWFMVFSDMKGLFLMEIYGFD